MKKIVAVCCLFFFGLIAFSQDHHWSYEGAEGPEHWGDLESCKVCGTGTGQSPVNITDSKLDKNLSKLTFNYTPAEVDDITDNGHSLQFDFKSGGSIVYNNKVYSLVQFHAHEESEHTIDGVRYPLELHFVHKAADGSILVIGVMVKDGKENSYFEKVKAFRSVGKGEKVNTKIEFNPEKVYPANKTYYHYMGSLTTPPCTENVNWIVFKNPITMTPAEISDIQKHLPKNNNRPVQPLNGRVITNN